PLVEDEDDPGPDPLPARVPAPRPPTDAVPQAGMASSTGRAPAASVAVPAAIVRGRCFMTGRDTGARAVDSRKLALTVLCALVDQEQAWASARAYGCAAGEGFALGRFALVGGWRLIGRGEFKEPLRSTGAFKRAEAAELAE